MRHCWSAPAIVIRRVDASDGPALRDLYAHLSSESRRRRFLGTTSGIGMDTSSALCTPDHIHEEGFVAVLRTVGREDGRLVGHVCLAFGEVGVTELAVAVDDDFQERGIGRRLFGAALEWGTDHDVERFAATAFADNTAVLRLLTSSPGAVVRPTDGGLVDVEIPVGSQ